MYEYYMKEGSESPLFFFKTDNGYTYNVSFSKFPYDIAGVVEVTNIDVTCIESDKVAKDLKVGLTISSIIDKFLIENPNNLITFVCDKYDNRDFQRSRKFNYWYSMYNPNGLSLKNYEVKPANSEEVYYTSVIYNSNIYSDDFIDSSYGNEIDDLQNK